MTEVMKSDVFFFVTTIAVVAVSVALVVAIIYVIRILRDAKELSAKAREEGTALLDDISEVREKVKSKSFGFIEILQSFFTSKKSKRKINKN